MPPAPARDAVVAEDITATALEALSFAHVPLPITHPPYPPSPTPCTQEALPPNIPLPLPATPNAQALQLSLRSLVTQLHSSLSPPHTHLTHALRALYPLVRVSDSFRHHLAHLNLVPLLLIAASSPLQRAPEALPVLRALLRDPLARSRFASADGPHHLLRLLQSALPEHPPSPLLIPICALLTDVLPHLPPHAVDVLRSASALINLRHILYIATDDRDAPLASAPLRLLAALQLPTPSVTQTLVRDLHIVPAALAALQAMPHQLTSPVLQFLHAAVQHNPPNVAVFATPHDSFGLDLILRIARRPTIPESMLPLLADLLTALAAHEQNFRRLLKLGLSPVLVALLPRLAPTNLPPVLVLLHRCLLSTAAPDHQSSLPQPDTPSAADALLLLLTTYTSNAGVQAAALFALAALTRPHAPAPPPTSLFFAAVQAAHFAMTEHAHDPRVLQACATLFLNASPAMLVRAACPIPHLGKLLRARLRTHCATDPSAHAAVSDAVLALDFIAAHAPPLPTNPADKLPVQAGVDAPQSKTRSSRLSMYSSRSGILSAALSPRQSLRASTRSAGGGGLRRSFHRRNRLVRNSSTIATGTKEAISSSSARKAFANSRRARSDNTLLYDNALPAAEHDPFTPASNTPAPIPPALWSLPLARALVSAREAVSDTVVQPTPPGRRRATAVAAVAAAAARDARARARAAGSEQRLGVGSVVVEEREWFGEAGAPVRAPAVLSDVAGSMAIRATVMREEKPKSDRSVEENGRGETWEQNSEFSISDTDDSGSFNGAWAGGEGCTPMFSSDMDEDELFAESTIGSAYEYDVTAEGAPVDGPGGGDSGGDVGGKTERGSDNRETSSPCTNGSSDSEDLEDGTDSFPDDFAIARTPSSASLGTGADSTDGMRMEEMRDGELLPRFRHFGERERRRGTTEGRLSGAWSRPNWSIWQAAPAEFGPESRSYPSNTFHPRVESGSLTLRR